MKIFERDPLSGRALFRFLSFSSCLRFHIAFGNITYNKCCTHGYTDTKRKPKTKTNHNKNLHAFVHMQRKKNWKLNWPKAYKFLGREKCRWWFFVCWIYAEIRKHWAHWHQSETVDDQKKSGWFACTRKMYRQVQCRAKEVHSSKHFFLPLLRFVCCCGCVIRWSDAIVTIFAVVNATKFIDSHEMNNQLPKKTTTTHTHSNESTIFNAHQKPRILSLKSIFIGLFMHISLNTTFL